MFVRIVDFASIPWMGPQGTSMAYSLPRAFDYVDLVYKLRNLV